MIDRAKKPFYSHYFERKFGSVALLSGAWPADESEAS